jgi:RNA polymerase sigma-70 factor (ECF subfamily)
MTLNPLETAYADLLEENYAALAGIARAYAPSSDQEDLLQEILLQVWRGLPKFEGRSHPGTWAYRVALNTALAWDRSARNRRQKLKIESHDVSQVDSLQSSEHLDTKILDEFLQSLSKVDRAVMLTFLDGVSNSDAAEIIGLSEGALRVRLHRLKRRFQETFCTNEED